MSRYQCDTQHKPSGFPRVSGDEPNEYQELGTLLGFSPRERG